VRIDGVADILTKAKSIVTAQAARRKYKQYEGMPLRDARDPSAHRHVSQCTAD